MLSSDSLTSIAWFKKLIFSLMLVQITSIGVCAKEASSENKANQVNTLSIQFLGEMTTVTQNIVNLFKNRIAERSQVTLVDHDQAADLKINLKIKSGIGTEGFEVRDNEPNQIEIIGNDSSGLLFGVGKFLRSSDFDDQAFVPGAWRGTSVPEKPMRGIYFATHFHNWHHVAPIEEITRYIEDQALWGTNAYAVWFDFNHFNGIEDPKAQAMLERLRTMFRTVKGLGLSTSLAGLSNEGYRNSPEELRGEFTKQNGYFDKPPVYQVELCPNKPGAIELEIKWHLERIRAFEGIGIDSVWLWPYDQGGCTCVKCAPWGSNGYLTMTEPLALAIKAYDPKIKTLISTWYFDRLTHGEWEGITEKFKNNRPAWADYVFIDQYGGGFPQYPLTHGSPGNIPVLNFSEISMYKHAPWGGYGANPTPDYLQGIWDQSKNLVSGGFPYSEGLYEDMNKAICAQFYWNSNRSAQDTIDEYVAYYFSPKIVNQLKEVVRILEKNLERERVDEDGKTFIKMKSTEDAEKAFEIVQESEKYLVDDVKNGWRWRIIYLRAEIDSELAKHNLRVSKKCNEAFQELNKIYHDQPESLENINPPNSIIGIVEE